MASLTSAGPTIPADLILTMLRNDVRNRIEAALTEVAKPIIRQAADDAVASLHLQIESMLDRYNNQFLVKVMDERKEDR